ncbi:unnamed protein product [Ectocarpus sp. CCAP 1310/34]|nr:unnamed protein product [Ectocarpus sp. CCAP 1310/34]
MMDRPPFFCNRRTSLLQGVLLFCSPSDNGR